MAATWGAPALSRGCRLPTASWCNRDSWCTFELLTGPAGWLSGRLQTLKCSCCHLATHRASAPPHTPCEANNMNMHTNLPGSTVSAYNCLAAERLAASAAHAAQGLSCRNAQYQTSGTRVPHQAPAAAWLLASNFCSWYCSSCLRCARAVSLACWAAASTIWGDALGSTGTYPLTCRGSSSNRKYALGSCQHAKTLRWAGRGATAQITCSAAGSKRCANSDYAGSQEITQDAAELYL